MDYCSVLGKRPRTAFEGASGHCSSFYTNVWDFDPG